MGFAFFTLIFFYRSTKQRDLVVEIQREEEEGGYCLVCVMSFFPNELPRFLRISCAFPFLGCSSHCRFREFCLCFLLLFLPFTSSPSLWSPTPWLFGSIRGRNLENFRRGFYLSVLPLRTRLGRCSGSGIESNGTEEQRAYTTKLRTGVFLCQQHEHRSSRPFSRETAFRIRDMAFPQLDWMDDCAEVDSAISLLFPFLSTDPVLLY